jgi:hypothetical protein
MILRPKTLAEVAERSDSMEDFGRTLRDWLHELRRLSSRPQAVAAISGVPRRLRSRFSDGAVADAWLAAYAEHLASRIQSVPPRWAFQRTRSAPEPWFADAFPNSFLRIETLRHTPLSFKRRNLYTRSVELPLKLKAGRPTKPMEEKKRANAERQGRFRAARKAELLAFRSASGR